MKRSWLSLFVLLFLILGFMLYKVYTLSEQNKYLESQKKLDNLSLPDVMDTPVPQPTLSPMKINEIMEKEAFYLKLISDQQVTIDQNCKKATDARKEANACSEIFSCMSLKNVANSWEDTCNADKGHLVDLELIRAGYGDVVEKIHHGQRDSQLLNDLDDISRNLEDINRKIGF